VTLYFLDDVFLLNLPLEPAKSIFQRLALLNANLCQKIPPPNLPDGLSRILEKRAERRKAGSALVLLLSRYEETGCGKVRGVTRIWIDPGQKAPSLQDLRLSHAFDPHAKARG
jgi:hypothetical protein